MKDLIRIGKVSTINYEAGTVSVTYTDRGGEVSPPFPVFSEAYEMPKIDDTVVVIMLPNSGSKGFIAGVPFSSRNVPEVSGAGIFCKKFHDGTKIVYNPTTRTLSVNAEKIKLEAIKADSVTVSGTVEADSIEADELTAGKVTVTESAVFKDLTVSGTATINKLIKGE
ncbi:MAG: hypothetical protein NC223_03200 [Butyrivibrio sp.]|nr:hypothetical protein [Butyrivibrio sp.]